jgi:hypothetical protein
MTGWTADELDKIETADELEIASLRSDGTLGSKRTIWVVRVDDDLRPVSERAHIREHRRQHPHAPGAIGGAEARATGVASDPSMGGSQAEREQRVTPARALIR